MVSNTNLFMNTHLFIDKHMVAVKTTKSHGNQAIPASFCCISNRGQIFSGRGQIFEEGSIAPLLAKRLVSLIFGETPRASFLYTQT